MTEEIKKIFYKLRSDEYYKEHYQQSVYYERDLKKLENYITNLQKENENLKQQLDFIDEQNKYIDKIEKMIKDYKSRNEKAIEYIGQNIYEITARFDGGKQLKNGELDDLLNILKGDDE